MTPDIREKAERLAAEVFETAELVLSTGAAEKRATDTISQALLEAHKAGREEAESEMKPARVYFERYCQDEADDVENCVCGEQQHKDAKAFAHAIRSLP